MNTILVVDDFNSVRLFHVSLLKAAGHSCRTATNGEEALRELRAGGVDVLVLDLVMPGLSGLKVLEEVRADRKLNRLPVVVITSESSASVPVDGLTRTLVKPVLPRQLLDSVRELLSGQGGAK